MVPEAVRQECVHICDSTRMREEPNDSMETWRTSKQQRTISRLTRDEPVLRAICDSFSAVLATDVGGILKEFLPIFLHFGCHKRSSYKLYWPRNEHTWAMFYRQQELLNKNNLLLFSVNEKINKKSIIVLLFCAPVFESRNQNIKLCLMNLSDKSTSVLACSSPPDVFVFLVSYSCRCYEMSSRCLWLRSEHLSGDLFTDSTSLSLIQNDWTSTNSTSASDFEAVFVHAATWLSVRYRPHPELSFLVGVSHQGLPRLHPFRVGELVADSSEKDRSHHVGRIGIKIAPTTSCRRRMRGAPQNSVAPSLILYPFILIRWLAIASHCIILVKFLFK